MGRQAQLSVAAESARAQGPLTDVVEADPELSHAVRVGLTAKQKWLPPWLLYDAAGSDLFEQITELPEYYPTRTEAAVFQAHAAELVRELFERDGALTLLELGAGTATKTELLLAALVRAADDPLFVPLDVSPTPLTEARARLARSLPSLRVEPVVGRNADVARVLGRFGGQRAVAFIGSSIGNYTDRDAIELLRAVHAGLAPGERLLLGTDLVKPLDVLLPAYDDAAGVTAAFDLNLLTRINRELDGDFVLERFHHEARWNELNSAVEMHLVSDRAQLVTLHALGLTLALQAGETIHTESSVKYTLPRVDALLAEAGFLRHRTFTDERGWFGVHVARALPRRH